MRWFVGIGIFIALLLIVSVTGFVRTISVTPTTEPSGALPVLGQGQTGRTGTRVVIPSPIPSKTVATATFTIQVPPTYTEMHGTLASGLGYIQMMSPDGLVAIRVQSVSRPLDTVQSITEQMQSDAGALRVELTQVSPLIATPLFGRHAAMVTAHYTAPDGTPMEAAEFSLYPYVGWFSAPTSQFSYLLGNLWEVTIQTVSPPPTGP